MKKFTSLVLTMLFGTFVFSQQLTYKQKATTPKANYYKIVASNRAKLSKLNMHILVNEKAQKQFERWAYYWKDRVYADGSFPPENLGYFNAGILDNNGKIITTPGAKEESLSATWKNIGAQTIPEHNGYPNYPQMGRVNCFLRLAHPSDMSQDILFVGAPAGGIWKSTDGGANWIPVLDEVAGIGVTDIASASLTYSPNAIIYVSTGDYDGENIKSIGILKSTDGGNSFQSTGLSFPLSAQEITSNLLVLSNDTVVVGTSQNIYKTTDGGTTWQSKKSSQFYEGFGRFVSQGSNMACIGIFGDIYFSNDQGETWTTIKTGGNDEDKNVLYLENDTLYSVNSTGQLSYFGQNGWINLGNPVPTYDSQGGYNQTLLKENNMIISADVNGFHSTDNGSTWYRSLNGYWQGPSDSGSYIHSDFHAMGELDNVSNTYKYWACNDGGLSYIEYSSAGAFKPTITYKSEKCIVTQLYSVAITPNNADGNMLQGNQDNDGFSREMHNGSMKWIAAAAGDGTATAIDYTDPKIRYLGSTKGSLSIAFNGFSGNYQGAQEVQIPGANFIWPLEMSTTNHNKLYGGGNDVYLLDASDNYSVRALNAGTGKVSFISTHNDGIFAIGESAVTKSLDGGQSWNTINGPGTKINSIDFSGINPNAVYATARGYIDGQKVYKSSDGGQTWDNISAGLPNILMKEVLIAQNKSQEILYLATELGVYSKIGDGQWTKLGGNTLPNVIVNDIDINYAENALVAATFGRGLWQLDISSLVGIDEKGFPENEKPSVFPNPVSQNVIHIKLLNFKNQSGFSYLIYNIVGGVIQEGKLLGMENAINVSSIAKGVYMIKISNRDQQTYVQKIVRN